MADGSGVMGVPEVRVQPPGPSALIITGRTSSTEASPPRQRGEMLPTPR
jgi:hypothetical protein